MTISGRGVGPFYAPITFCVNLAKLQLRHRSSSSAQARLALPSWAKEEPWRQKLLSASAGLFWRQKNPIAVLRFLHLVGGQTEERSWQQVALLEGLTSMPVKAAKGGGFGKAAKMAPRVVTLPTAPEALEKLRKAPDTKLAAAADAMAKQLNWPGKREALLTANAPIAKTLRPCRAESVDFDTTKNLFIEGDKSVIKNYIH